MPNHLCGVVPAALLATAGLVGSALRAQTPAQTTIAVAAQATVSPPAIAFAWPADPTATAWTVARRTPGASSWGVLLPLGGASTTSWTDTNVVPGARYEYWFNKNGPVPAKTFLIAGVAASPLESRGKLVLLVDATHAAVLASRLDRLVQDLTGDGWFVLRHDVSPALSVPSVKALIVADVAADPANVKAVLLLGHVPVPYSGAINPDGHPDHLGAWAADVYYGELNGPWTDTSVNVTTASRPENRNVPGDGKFDQSAIPSDVDLMVGRVDFADMPAFGSSEATLLAAYLDKNHDYRQRVFAVEQRAVIDDNFGWFSGEAFSATGWRNFWTLLGAANVTAGDYFGTLNTTSGNGHVWSYGCGGGSYTSAGGIGSTTNFTTSTNRNVFTILFGSYFGDWDSTNNFLRAPLCSGWTLTNFWAGRPHWSFHQMGMGEPIGAGTRYSQNDMGAGGFGTRWVHVALMGDPTLRQHVIAPPSDAAVAQVGAQAIVTWTASPDVVAGYHVYRAPDAAGPFTRLTTLPVANTTFADPGPVAGLPTYMVRALRLETTPTGSYWNLSQGAFATLPMLAAGHTSYGAGCYTPALTLSASPAPVSTAVAGTLVTYSIDAIPESAPGSGAYIGAVILSFTTLNPGLPLAFVGMPGCSLHVGSFDALLPFGGSTPSATAPLSVPPGVPYGTELFATAVALFAPNTLPNGQNPFGAVTSNGLASFVSSL